MTEQPLRGKERLSLLDALGICITEHGTVSYFI